MPLSPTEQAELDAARAALAKASAGTLPSVVQGGGRRVEFGKADPAALQRTIDRLEGLAVSGRRRGAIGFRL
jgi:hypothetical protein